MKLRLFFVFLFLVSVMALTAQNTGLFFNGTSNYVTLGTNASNPDMSGATGITLSAWIRPNSLRTGADSNRNTIIDFPCQTTSSMVSMYLRENGKVRFGGRSQASDAFQDLVTTNAVIATNTWQYVTGVLDYSAQTVRFYLNGSLVQSSTGKAFGSSTYIPGNGNAEIIGCGTGLVSTHFYHGMIDEVKLWNVPLTQAQIQFQMYKEYTTNLPANLVGYWNFNEGSGTTAGDLGAGSNDGTIFGATWSESITLPVELSSFAASPTAQNYVTLQWVTQSETNVLGYYIYRNGQNDVATASIVSPLITATNTTNQTTYTYTDTDVDNGQWYYWLQNVDFDGTDTFHGPVLCTVGQSNESGTPPIPVKSGIQNIYPNPFNPTTTLVFYLVKPGFLDVSIYNSRGQIVRGFNEGFKENGEYRLLWDGMDDNGAPCASGTYVIRMKSGNDIFMRKAMLLK